MHTFFWFFLIFIFLTFLTFFTFCFTVCHHYPGFVWHSSKLFWPVSVESLVICICVICPISQCLLFICLLRIFLLFASSSFPYLIFKKFLFCPSHLPQNRDRCQRAFFDKATCSATCIHLCAAVSLIRTFFLLLSVWNLLRILSPSHLIRFISSSLIIAVSYPFSLKPMRTSVRLHAIPTNCWPIRTFGQLGIRFETNRSSC